MAPTGELPDWHMVYQVAEHVWDVTGWFCLQYNVSGQCTETQPMEVSWYCSAICQIIFFKFLMNCWVLFQVVENRTTGTDWWGRWTSSGSTGTSTSRWVCQVLPCNSLLGEECGEPYSQTWSGQFKICPYLYQLFLKIMYIVFRSYLFNS